MKNTTITDAARKYLIDTINNLYPPDSEYEDINEIGQRLLREAIQEWTDTQLPAEWTELPIEILEDYARKCARLEFRDYPGCDADRVMWWGGYLEVKKPEEKPAKTLVSDMTFTAKTLGPPAGWDDDEEWKEWIEFSFAQIGEKYPDDNVFYCIHPTGEPIACYLDSLAIKTR